jgi:DNA-binding NarL/FixJ family response regulator
MSSPRRVSRAAAVIIVEPIGIVRMSLRQLFEAVPDIEVIGEAAEADPALELIASLQNHAGVVALLGVELTGEHDSFWLIRAIRDRSPQLSILATGTDLQPGAISQALFMGADGFIHKNSPPERFIEATKRASAGELVLEGLPRGALGGIVERMDQQRAVVPVLTNREQMVLTAAAEGLTAREIGRKLGVRERTVTTHLDHIYRKLGASGRVAALTAAMRLGVLSLPAVSAVVSVVSAVDEGVAAS